MYSQQGSRPGIGPPKMPNRYMRGRLPEGVDFAAYPGRSSTPLPTAESKSAERINQLKIWNEAATNDEKRRLNAAKGIGSAAVNPITTRRTDSFKDAKERHSASFHGTTPSSLEHADPDHIVNDAVAHPPSYNRSAVGHVDGPVVKENDIYADRSDSETDDDVEDTTAPTTYAANTAITEPTDHVATQQPAKPAAVPQTTKPSVLPMPTPYAMQQTHTSATNHNKSAAAASIDDPEPKRSKACCNIM